MILSRLVLICLSIAAATEARSFVVKRSISRGYAIPQGPNPTDESIANVTSILNSDPVITSFHVNSEIEFRYARTTVTSHVKNPSSISKEVTFTAIIPNSAFVSNFSMTFDDGEEYVATVAAKEEAKRVYEEAVTAGRGAGLVSQDVRDSNKFTVSANVEGQAKVVFKMTYEELLERKLGWYEHVININPGQVVDDLSIVVNIDESRPLDKLSVPELKQSNEIDFEPGQDNKIADVDWKEGNATSRIEFAPNKEQQEEYGEQGLAGQLLVKYDVERNDEANEIQVIDGYFVHFFTPENLKTLPKHVIFVLDISGSMSGDKIVQLKDAMFTILDDMTGQDYFNIITFSSSFNHWHLPSKDDLKEEHIPNFDYHYDNYEVKPIELIQATDENRREAIKYTNSINANGGTNINDGLQEGLKLAAEAKKNEALPTNLQSIVVFLSDGEATSGVTNINTIKNNVKNANVFKVPIYSLGFGRGADFSLIKDISLDSGAFAKHIYEDSDAALQLEDFFAEISSPLLSNLKFNYVGGLVDNSSISQNHLATFYKGGEFIVTGKLQNTTAQENDFLEVTVTASGENGTEYDHKASICLRPCALPGVNNVTDMNDLNYDNSQLHPPLTTCPLTCLPPPPPPPARSNAQNFLRNLHAFLNIKQLLKKTDKTINGTNPSKEKALRLSLDNKFVTELTSLVVTRPNETAKISSLHDANAPQPQRYNYQNNLMMTMSMPMHRAAPPSRRTYHMAMPQGMPGPAPNSRSHIPRPMPTYGSYYITTTYRPLTRYMPRRRTTTMRYPNYAAPMDDYYMGSDEVAYDGGQGGSAFSMDMDTNLESLHRVRDSARIRTTTPLPPTCSGNMTMFSKTYYRGESITVTGDRTELGDFDDKVVSIKVEGSCCWKLFTSEGYQGEYKVFKEGDYKSTQHVGKMFRDASSVKKINIC